ncbi:MAG TPA: hypothetical protein VFQ38_20615 [Longimicrobiales bacterium]|nr:hypothetical protein [Longimicrobiales bacterium]
MRPRSLLSLVVAALLAAAGCRHSNPEDEPISQPAPPPAAVMSPALDSLPLDAKLSRMQQMLDAALVAGPTTNAGRIDVFAAEVISDRLLEVPPPVAWLRTAYGTESRLRQLQSLADRIVAELRREDTSEAALTADIRLLRKQVAALRGELAQGGTTAPWPMDSLLTRIPTQHTAGGSEGAVE